MKCRECRRLYRDREAEAKTVSGFVSGKKTGRENPTRKPDILSTGARNTMMKITARRNGDWILTHSGTHFWPLDPRPEEILIDDIAHSLSNQCRFTGHVRSFYSVAEHSLHVSWLCDEDKVEAMWGLLHDASEAYLVDLPRPLKHHSEFGAPYRTVEAGLMRCIAERFSLPPDEPESVSKADKVMLGIEARDLMGAGADPAWQKWIKLIGKCERSVADPLTPSHAKTLFLWRYHSLAQEISRTR